MTRREYTPADLATLALPGSLPGMLPRWKDAPAVWTGPVEIVGAHPLRPGDWTVTAYGDGGMANGADLSRLRLPLSRPEARFRVACWLAEGEPCYICLRHKFLDAPACATCKGTGYLRPPAPLWWALSGPGPGSLPAWVGASVLHVSALRVAAGMRAVVQVDRCTVPTGAERDDFVEWSTERGNAVLLDGDVLAVEVPS